jgi:hypothetical protein
MGGRLRSSFRPQKQRSYRSGLAYGAACQHLLGLTIAGALLQRYARSTSGALQQNPNVVPLYLAVIAVEWFLVYGFWAGIRDRGLRPDDLVGGMD